MLERLQCPSGKEIELIDAPLYFEEAGIAPAEAIAYYIRSERPGILPPSPFEQVSVEPRHGDKSFSPKLSPSSCSPTSTCIREIACSRALPFVSNPSSGWMANEGTALWTSLKRGGAISPPFEYEVEVPGGGNLVEVVDGWSTRGTVDKLRRDEDGFIEEIQDIKTKKYTKGDRGLEDDWRLQLNVYAHIVANAGLTRDGRLPKMFVWRVYRGAYDSSRVFRKFFVPPLDRLQLEAKIGPFVRENEALLTKTFESNDLRSAVAALPMYGEIKQLFGGKKCSQYCRVTDVCYDLAGKKF